MDNFFVISHHLMGENFQRIHFLSYSKFCCSIWVSTWHAHWVIRSQWSNSKRSNLAWLQLWLWMLRIVLLSTLKKVNTFTFATFNQTQSFLWRYLDFVYAKKPSLIFCSVWLPRMFWNVQYSLVESNSKINDQSEILLTGRWTDTYC